MNVEAAIVLFLLGFGAKPPDSKQLGLFYRTSGDAAAKRVLDILDATGRVVTMTSTGKELTVWWEPRSANRSAPQSGKGFKLESVAYGEAPSLR